MNLGNLWFEKLYCPHCHDEQWHLLCHDGHLECLACKAAQHEEIKEVS